MKCIKMIKTLPNKAAFARVVGVTPQGLNKWVLNNNVPSWHLAKVADQLGITVDQAIQSDLEKGE